MLIKELREQVAFYGKQMLKSGLTMNTGGNISARCRETGLIAIKPSAKHYDELCAEDITVIDIEGNVLEGKYKPSSEWPMHTLIYKTYPRACGIVHCHSVYATAMAVAGMEIPLINHELCVYCSQPVRVMPFVNPGSLGLGESAILGFGDNNTVALLQNHGSIAMGGSLWHAYDGVCAAEIAAQAYCIAKSLGVVNILPKSGQEYLRSMDPMQGQDSGGTGEIKSV